MFRVAIVMALALVGCSTPTTSPGPTAGASTSSAPEPNTIAQPDPSSSPIPDTSGFERAGGIAYFAGGCFWGVEHYMQDIEGVVLVESGYMGGHVDNPSYRDVSHQDSGHLETVRVIFDPSKVSYQVIAQRFFEIHDPTQADGQGPDIGPEYRSAVFVIDDAQRAVVEALITTLEARGYDVVTEIKPLAKFWIAEDYHQDYYDKDGSTPYCHSRVDRFGRDPGVNTNGEGE